MTPAEAKAVIADRYAISDDIRPRRRARAKAGKTPQRPPKADATEAAFPATTIEPRPRRTVKRAS